MPKKTVLIGAGSQVFARNPCRDILTFPSHLSVARVF